MRRFDREEGPGYVSTLLELSRILNSTLELPEVLRTAMDEVVAFVGAERGFVLLLEEDGRKVAARATHAIDPDALERALTGRESGETAEISRRIVERVLKERVPMSSLNAMEDPRFSGHTSVRTSRLRSVLCVPLLVKDKLLGIVYVDNRVKSGAFNQRHLTMLAAFSNQASVAIENARLYESLRDSMEEKLRLQKELHEEEAEKRALAEANRAKTEAIGFVAHELRNPLTVIGGSAQTLLAFGSSSAEMVAEMGEMIDAETQRMMVLINEMLDSSRLESGKPLSLSARTMDVAPTLDKLARAQKFYKYWKPSHTLRLEVDPDLPETEVDEDKLRQIVANLLSNAIKYSPDGGVIRLTARGAAGGLEISVSDQGIGMTPDQQSRLFAKFERVQRSEISQIPGTGLGLFLTRELIHLHGGTITCESEAGAGTTFRVWMPLRQGDPLPLLISDHAVVTGAASDTAPLAH